MKTSLHPVFFQSFRIIARLGSAVAICAALVSSAYADDEHIKPFQKAASIAYEEMMKAKQTAENSAKDTDSAKKKLESLKKKVNAAEIEYAAAKKEADQAKLSFERATAQWKQASDSLAAEWNKSNESK